MVDFRMLREQMVSEQLVARGVADDLVLNAMRRVPREEFVRPSSRMNAYDDHPLQLDHGQTISQPYIVALTLEAAALTPEDVLLDVGTGSGYAAAVAAEVVRRVISIERHAALAETARAVLKRLGYSTVDVVVGDGTLGYPSEAPFDAIVAAAAGPKIPAPWVEQLRANGRIVMPVGEQRFGQTLIRALKDPSGAIRRQTLGAVTFVPLIGEHGISDR
ncbi:protein-L-isoaspartate(D-aspartate) O-methyltransferase [Okibacterium sp. HSC-33S16]|uniref:protein-L-isoaspartate(D-aspartate) O-methyltransferase n=1 Tax=Okibacterium sp. HSC-33S16 TaxID=2910965 RepID=UPI0020A0F22A|nr:protein-L-isoaspartate(D-aspartate) O-methyltransferase [Okibacterium sp. HSC-33S16]MCP2030904.1 protein-L-isoaspartate(D-aspartate) O-methyltransferase [Okibacterium sp. HSC-33S16]